MIRASAPGKINLVFQVGSLQGDGYHPVNSLYLELELREQVTLTKTNKAVNISVTSDSLPQRHVNSVPLDSSNLVYQVGKRMFEDAGIDFHGLDIAIDKSVPVAGGMAGGSADAAAMIVATNTFLHEEYDSPLQSKSDLIELAKQFGSDVPFSLVGGLAIGRNRGEQLEVLEPLSFDAYFVLAISSEGLSTPQVFHRFDEIGVSSEFTDLKKPISSLTELASLMSNDLESAAISLLPSIRNSLDVLELAGAKKAMLSGSGPTVFGLFDSKELAEQAVQTLMQMGMTALVVQPSYGGTRLES